VAQGRQPLSVQVAFITMAPFLLNGCMSGSEYSAQSDISTGKLNRSRPILWPQGQVMKQGICPRS